MMNTLALIWKGIRSHVWVALFFLVISLIFFAPKFQGMQLHQGDIQQYLGMAQEVKAYYEQEGVGSSWTGSMFSGMPTYTISTQGGPLNVLNYLEMPIKALGSGDVGVVFFSLISFYILMLTLGASIPIALLGAFAFSFSSYSVIILQAGHITKAWVMAYMPLVLAGFFMILRQKIWVGGLVFALALALQIKNYHIQVSYYLALFCAVVYLGYFIQQIRGKQWKAIRTTFLTLCIATTFAALCNMGMLYSNLELAEESIRGGSELTHQVDGKKEQKSTGLDKDHAFAWSYGLEETFTLLIPNFYGGASGGSLGRDSHLGKQLQRGGYAVPDQISTYTYWGNQPFTSGPVYFGAIICMLFVFALFVIKNPLKWWIFGASLFFILLSWGKNFDAFNTFMFHHLPLYNKFRTVSMALVIPQLTFCLFAAWGLMELVSGKGDKKQLLKALYYAVGITGGLCLYFALMTPLSFYSLYDAHYQMQGGLPDWYMSALRLDRADLLRSDAFRSLLFILLAGGCIYLFIQAKKTSPYLIYLIVGLVLVDLWQVDRRYLNETHFVKGNVMQQSFAQTPVDQAILRDKDPSYRVLTLADPFNNSTVSYYHKSIGGYNAAKLRRYQDLIEMKLQPEIVFIQSNLGKLTSQEEIFRYTPTLNMLNMRYLIKDQYIPLKNPHALGNAWFVSSVQMVENADGEMEALQRIDPSQVALVDQRFAAQISKQHWEVDSLAEIKLISYKPDRLEYRYRSSKPGVVVFSEVYYPHGWKAMIDGKETEHFRTNWILRGMEVPAGEHTISFRFEPDAYIMGRWMSTICSAFLVIVALFFLFRYGLKLEKR